MYIFYLCPPKEPGVTMSFIAVNTPVSVWAQSGDRNHSVGISGGSLIKIITKLECRIDYEIFENSIWDLFG